MSRAPDKGRDDVTANQCARLGGLGLGEPITSTMEVANGIAISGSAMRTANPSMMPIATAPPTAPASIAHAVCCSAMLARPPNCAVDPTQSSACIA